MIFQKLKNSILIWAARKNNKKLLTDKNADVYAKSYYGRKALMETISNGHLDVAKLLIDKNVDVNAKDKYGYTALIAAISNRHLDVAKLLIDKNADVNAKLDNGYTALIAAVSNGHLDVAKLLIDKNADVNTKNEDGDTPLMEAISNRHLDVAKLLIDKNADVNAKLDSGYTPLMKAISNGHLDAVKLLIDKNADVNAKDKYGNTPLMEAARRGKDDIVKLIVEAGADLSVTNSNNNIMTFYHNQLEMVEFLMSHGLDYDLNVKVKDTTLISIANSIQSSHNIDLVSKPYSHFMNDTTRTELKKEYSKEYISKLQIELKKTIINNENSEFKSLFLELVNQKLEDCKAKIGQGDSFIKDLLKANNSKYSIEKIKSNECELDQLKIQLKEFIYSDDSQEYFCELIKRAANIQETLQQQKQINIENITIETNLIIPLIQKIAIEEQKSSQDIMNRLSIELIDAATMYGSGSSSCVKGILNKLATVLIDFIPDKNDHQKVAYFPFEGFLVNYNQLLESALNHFDKENKIDIKKPLKNSDVQKIRSFIYKILKTDAVTSEEFITIVHYGESENVFAKNNENIEQFRRELTYEDLSKEQKAILMKNNGGEYEIPKEFRPVIVDDKYVGNYQSNVNEKLKQDIIAKLIDLQDEDGKNNEQVYEDLIKIVKSANESILLTAENLQDQELVDYLGDINISFETSIN